MELKGKRILITGGAGLIGSHIADQLAVLEPAEIIIFDNFVRGRRENICSLLQRREVTVVEGDIRDCDALNRVMQSVDVLFHQAAIRITQCAEEPRLAIEVMADGTYNVLEAAVKAEVDRVVAASSASVYGLAEAFPTGENHHPYHNRTLYGATKVFNEGLLRAFHEMYGLDYVALRYFNVYGPRMDIYGAYTEVLIRWMDRLEDGQPPIIFGDGSETMDFIYVEDVARCNILAAQADVSDEVFNVASGTETSLKQLADILAKVMNSELTVQFGPKRTVNAVTRRLAATDKAKRLLEFEAKVGLEEGLKRLVRWRAEQKSIT